MHRAKRESPWEDGYQALALLDMDHNRRLSGKELAPLALWFDKNRDGISQPGEVRTLSSLHVVAIFYLPSRTDPKSGNVEADIGYLRVVNGKFVRGKSVDWFAPTFSSRQEAAVALAALFQQEKRSSSADDDTLDSRTVDVQTQSNDPLEFSPHKVMNHREDLSGYWAWTVKDCTFPENP